MKSRTNVLWRTALIKTLTRSPWGKTLPEPATLLEGRPWADTFELVAVLEHLRATSPDNSFRGGSWSAMVLKRTVEDGNGMVDAADLVLFSVSTVRYLDRKQRTRLPAAGVKLVEKMESLSVTTIGKQKLTSRLFAVVNASPRGEEKERLKDRMRSSSSPAVRFVAYDLLRLRHA